MADRPQIDFPFPAKGITENSSYGKVPEGFALDAMNVVSFDVLEGRLRGGKRPGTGRAIHDAVDGSNPIQRIKQVTLDSAEFTDAAGFFDDPFFEIGSGPTGNGPGGGWGFPDYNWEFPDGDDKGGFGIHGIDPEFRRDEDAPPDQPVVALEVEAEDFFAYSNGNLSGNGGWSGPTTNNRMTVVSSEGRTTFTSVLPPASAVGDWTYGVGNLDAAYPWEVEGRAAIHVPVSGYCRLNINVFIGDTTVICSLSSNGLDLSAGGHVAIAELNGNAAVQTPCTFVSGSSVRFRLVWNPFTGCMEIWINDTKRLEQRLTLADAIAAGNEDILPPVVGFEAENVSSNPSTNSSGFHLDALVVRGIAVS